MKFLGSPNHPDAPDFLMDIRFWLTFVFRLAILLVGALIGLRLIENRFVFYPEKIPNRSRQPLFPADLKFEECWIQAADGTGLNGWLLLPLQKSAAPPITMLYLHGNGGSLFGREERLAMLARQGWRIFALDYRGYGKSAGSPREAGLYQDARAAYDWLIRQRETSAHSLFFFGESLGSAVAIQLALDRSCAGVILEAPFTSFADMGKVAFPWIPRVVYRFFKNDWNSLHRIPQLPVPVFIMHGDRDRVIPFVQGQRLFEAASPPKVFFQVRGGDHLDGFEMAGPELLPQLRLFIQNSVSEKTR